MKSKKVFTIAVLIVAFIFVLSGCGNDTADSAEQASLAGETKAAEAETVQQAITEQITEVVDTKTNVDELIGSWIDISAADRFVNITKEGTQYQYEDNEGKLPATFEGGILKVKVSDTETADVFIDAESGNLFLAYLDNISEYTKKQ